MFEIFRKKPEKGDVVAMSNISTLVRKGNDFFSDELILLDEKLSANLFCAEKIIIEQNGILTGSVTSKFCEVSGTIIGNIVSTEQMDIRSTAVIKGNIKSALINIEQGAVINGSIATAEDGRIIIANLLEKIKNQSPDAHGHLSAQLKGAAAKITNKDIPRINIKVKEEQPLSAPPAGQDMPLKQDMPVEMSSPVEPDVPVELIKKPIAAPAAPQPKVIAPAESVNQRWW